jgi:hypothetical protein
MFNNARAVAVDIGNNGHPQDPHSLIPSMKHTTDPDGRGKRQGNGKKTRREQGARDNVMSMGMGMDTGMSKKGKGTVKLARARARQRRLRGHGSRLHPQRSRLSLATAVSGRSRRCLDPLVLYCVRPKQRAFRAIPADTDIS